MFKSNPVTLSVTVFAFLLMMSCAHTSHLLSYKPQPGSDPKKEWDMHDAKTEWWYITGMLTDKDSNLYFYQYTLFHGIRYKLQGFATHIAITDFSKGKHYFEDQKYAPSKKCHSVDGVILCPNSSLKYGENSISISAEGEVISMELSFDIDGNHAWHGNDGEIAMGSQKNPAQSSYYYSYPKLKAKGWISIKNMEEQQNRMEMQVNGDGWFDKQWGNFKITPWQWFSLRFDDGDRVMLFYFPDSGHKEGTFIPLEGQNYPFSDFSVFSDTINDTSQQIEMEWKVSIPLKEKDYCLEPVLKSPYQKTSLGVTYWEGLCRLLDLNGNNKGWCVVEITK